MEGGHELEQEPDPQPPAWGASGSDGQTGELGARSSGDQAAAVGTSEWVACTSDGGDTYYTNVVTGETSWDVPAEQHEEENRETLVGQVEAGMNWITEDRSAAAGLGGPEELAMSDSMEPMPGTSADDEQAGDGEVYAVVWETLERLEQQVEDLLALEDPEGDQSTAGISDDDAFARTTIDGAFDEHTSVVGSENTHQKVDVHDEDDPGLDIGYCEATCDPDTETKSENSCERDDFVSDGASKRVESDAVLYADNEAVSAIPSEMICSVDDQQESHKVLELKEQPVEPSSDSLSNIGELRGVEVGGEGDTDPVEWSEEPLPDQAGAASLHADDCTPESEPDRPGTTDSTETLKQMSLTPIEAPDPDTYHHSTLSGRGSHSERTTDMSVPAFASDNAGDHVIEWLELYDEELGAACYYALQSGELRWELPDTAADHIRQCDGEAVVRAVVAIQSTARAHQARTRVFAMKQQRLEEFETEKQWPEWILPGDDAIGGFPDLGSPREQETGSEPEALWVEVYDPVQHVQYYYCSRTGETRWDAPDVFVSAAEDREVAAAITIQSLSRTRLARRQLQALKEEQKPRDMSPQAHAEAHAETHAKEDGDREREATGRREMVQQELLQLAYGDRFWGLDVHMHEVERQKLEEELMARAEVLYRSANSSSGELLMSSSSEHMFQTYEERIMEEDEEFDDDEDNPERQLREFQDESDARVAMATEEMQQCADGDSFWGIQAEEIRQNEARAAMAKEEAASRQFGEDLHTQTLCAEWAAEAERNAEEEFAARGGQEKLAQTRYLRWFYQQCISVDELLEYNWPTKQQQQQQRLEELPTPIIRKRQPVAPQPPPLLGPGTPYLLDDLVVRERLERGDLRYGLRSLMTVHHQHTNGIRSSRFDIAQATPDCAFNSAAAAALLRRRDRCGPFDPRRQSYHGMPLTPDMRYPHDGECVQDCEGPSAALRSINYHRLMAPDPNVPARFNGVPYRPSQLSPTREILCGDHRKLTQLPSLAKPKPGKGTQRKGLRKLQRAKPNGKTKARARAKAKARSGMGAQHRSNNDWDSLSAREREESDPALGSNCEGDDDADNEDKGGVEVDPREQFAREEHRVLARVFALMDLDESGTVNQREMRWALRRDEEIHTLATTSPLLRLLLKRRTYMEYLFAPRDEADDAAITDVDAGPASDGSELSWEVFLERCEHMYLQLMAEGLIPPILVVPDITDEAGLGEENRQDDVQPHDENGTGPGQEEDEESHEEHTIRRVFALLDGDGNGVLELAEVRQALYETANSASNAIALANADTMAKELHDLVADSKALQPMLHEELFMTAFSRFEPLDPRGICEEEFVAFCLEIAQVAAANNMAVTAE